MKKLLLLGLLAALLVPRASGEEYPVLCWTYQWYGQIHDLDQLIRDWKDLGITHPLTPITDGSSSKERNRAFLKKCVDAGLHPFIYDTRICNVQHVRAVFDQKGEDYYRELVKQVVADWNVPGIAGFYVGDEPDAEHASVMFKAARIQKEVAPNLQPLLNLLPWFDWIAKRIGADSLGAYLDRAYAESGIDFLGYDCYAQQILGREEKNLNDYFHNLREWAEFGKRSGSHWNTTLLCVEHFKYTIDSDADYRWQISTAAAMGAKGINWFYPSMEDRRSSNYRNAPINSFGERTQMYEWLSTEMRMFQREFGPTMMTLDWEASYLTKKSLGGIPLLESASNCVVRSISSENNMLVSLFKDKQGQRYVALVDLAREKPDGFNLTFAPGAQVEQLGWDGWAPLQTVYDPLDTAKRGPQTVWIWASPGQMFLMRVSPDLPPSPSIPSRRAMSPTTYTPANGEKIDETHDDT